MRHRYTLWEAAPTLDEQAAAEAQAKLAKQAVKNIKGKAGVAPETTTQGSGQGLGETAEEDRPSIELELSFERPGGKRK